MASGVIHDFTGIAATIGIVPVVLTEYPELTAPVVIGAGLGVMLLSPDLDMKHSWPSKRWGLLHFSTDLYRVFHHKHRGASHLPVIGAGLRTLFLGLWVAIFNAIVLAVNPNAFNIFEWFVENFLYIYLGVEYTSMVHVLFDLLANVFPALNDRSSFINRMLD